MSHIRIENFYYRPIINDLWFKKWNGHAILWNGKWHYEKITKKHSVLQVQNRDKIKINEIESFGYAPYIIKDMGKFNLQFVKEQFDLFIEKITGVGNDPTEERI